MRIAWIVVAVLCSAGSAFALEPGHPNPTTCVEQAKTAYLTRVTMMANGKVVSAEFAYFAPATLRRCKGRLLKECRPRGLQSSKTKIPRDKATLDRVGAQALLRTLDFVASTKSRPYSYWNINKLAREIMAWFGRRRKKDLETRLAGVMKRLGITASRDNQVIEVPIGKHAFEVKTLGAYYYVSYGHVFARWYVIDAKLAP